MALLEGEGTGNATGTRRYRAALLDRRGGRVHPLGDARGLAQAAQQAGAARLTYARIQTMLGL